MAFYFKIWSLFISLVFAPSILFAQPNKLDTNWILSTQIPAIKEGLSHNIANVFHQDHLGFIWIGTNYGLNRYDGHQVQRFYFDQAGYASNRITHILEDAKGMFWLIDAKNYFETTLEVNQVIYWDPMNYQLAEESQIIQPDLPFDWSEVQHFFQDKDGQLYFYTKQAETWIYNARGVFEKLFLGEKVFPIQASTSTGIWGQSGNKVMHLAEDATILRSFEIGEDEKCQLLVEGFKQAVHYKSHLIRSLPIPMAVGPFNWKTGIGAPLPEIVQSKLDKRGNRSILKVDQEKNIYWTFSGRWLPHNQDGTLMISPDKAPKVSRFPYLQDYLFDDSGMIWNMYKSQVITQKLELDFFQRFLNEPQSANNSSYKVRGILAQGGKILAGTSNGNQLIDMQSGNMQQWQIDGETMAMTTCFSFLQENDSTAWCSNYTLFKINTKTWEIEKKIELSDSNLAGIRAKNWGSFRSNSGKWWMKKKAYLHSYDSEQVDTLQTFEQYNEFEELRTKLVYHFHENERGIWLATYAGLFLLDEEKGIKAQFSTRYKEKNYLPTNQVHYIHPDTGAWLWLATADLGLVHWNYETGHWSNLSSRDGLPSNNLYAILSDSLDYFWISSENGLIRLHPDRKTFNLFFKEQGLPTNEFNRMAYHQGNDGYFYFGGQQGFIRFQPDNFNSTNSYASNLSISRGSIYNKEGSIIRKLPANNQRKQKIYLKSNEKRIDLYFALQNYFQSEKHEYWYRIAKGKDGWSKLNGNQLNLGGLTYGKNKFRVRAIQADGIIADNVMVLTIFQQAPFYLRWWFLLLTTLGLVFFVYYYIQWRTKKYQQQQKTLEQEVARRVAQVKQDQVIIESQAAALKALSVGFVEQIDQLILQNLNNPDFSVEELAKSAGLSRSQLHRKLKQIVQQTTSQRIREIRMKKAKELLVEPSLSIAEIAYQCGFQDANYFSRLFKQEFGISAKVYREQL